MTLPLAILFRISSTTLASVILLATSWIFSTGEELNPQNKSQLIGVLSHDVSLNGEKQPVSYAIEKVVQNLIRCFKGEADTLILPKLLPIEVHRYE